MVTAADQPCPDSIEFHLRRVAFECQARSRAPLWALVQDMPAVCACLLDRLGPFDVGLNDLRLDNGDGNLGRSNLGFWAFDLGVRCEIRLASVDVRCHELNQVDVRQLDRLTQAVLGAVLEGQPGASFSEYEVTFRMHGAPDTLNPATFLQRFTGSEPEGLGPVTASGASFHFGPGGRRVSCAVSADVSELFTDSIHVGSRAVFDAERVPREELMMEAGDYMKASLAALGLILPATKEST